MHYQQAALGFRVWTVSGNKLQSIISRNIWYQGQNAAQCSESFRLDKYLGVHRAPVANCQCGFHAYHRFSDAFEHADKLWRILGLETIVGVIAGSGDIQIHYDGFRSQLAQPLALMAESRHHPGKLFSASDYYEIPLLSREEITDEANYENVITIPIKERPPRDGRLIQETPDAP